MPGSRIRNRRQATRRSPSRSLWQRLLRFASSGEGGPTTTARGRAAEARAAEWLVARGFRIVERNVRFRHAEIDLVALEGETLCFVEVKLRVRSDYGGAIAALSPAQRRRITRAARLYLASRGHSGPCRFDVLAMGTGEEPLLLRNAFEDEEASG